MSADAQEIAAAKGRDPLAAEVGMRVRQVRKALHMPPDLFAAEIGVSASQLNVYEIGRVILQVGPAREIKTKFGVTFEWLYDGDPLGLSLRWYRALVPDQDQSPAGIAAAEAGANAARIETKACLDQVTKGLADLGRLVADLRKRIEP